MVSTSDVAAAYDISETAARRLADEIGVARIGASFAWAREDVEALAEILDEETEDEEDDDDLDEDDDDEANEDADYSSK